MHTKLFYYCFTRISLGLFYIHKSKCLNFKIVSFKIWPSMPVFVFLGASFLNPICPGSTLYPPPPRWLFDHCILTDRALKLILYDVSSNFMWNMWPLNFFLISQIICPHWLVCWWPSTTVAYYGIVNSLLHHLSFRNWIYIWLFDCNPDSYCVQFNIFYVSRK